MQRSLADLKMECQALGLRVVPTGGREAKKDFITSLREYFLVTKGRTFGLDYRLGLESPQLAFLSTNLRDEEIKHIMTSPEWVFEEKLNGVRMIITYHPEVGFEAFGRNLSVTDYLPVPYGEKIYLGESNYKGLFPAFVLDCELMSRDKNISTVMGKRGVVTETELAAVTALLALNTEDSIRIQKELDRPLVLKVFDCLYHDKQDLRRKPYLERRKMLSQVVTLLQGVGIQVEKVKAVRDSKEEYLDYLWSQGGEGVIAKNIRMTYLDKVSRPRDGWVKFKRTVGGALGDTVDGFVTGFELGDERRGFSDLVGALHVSVWLTAADGSKRIHEVARVANITLEERKKITVVGPNGPELDKGVYEKVVEVEGQAVSARAMRLTHPRLIRFRDDKNPDQCVISESELRKQIM